MKIAQVYSHLNGEEFLIVHKPQLWEEIQACIRGVDANLAYGKVSREKTMRGKILYSPQSVESTFQGRVSAERMGGK